MKNIQKEIDRVKALLTIAKLHLDSGITYSDCDINDHIAGLEFQLAALTNDTFVTAIENIWKK